jgi:predicted phosphodiesterase
MRIIYLADLHGNFNLLHHYIDYFGVKDAHIIQLGDFGVGFQPVRKEKRMLEMYHKKLVDNNVIVWAIRGNHDFKGHFDKDPFKLTNIRLVADYTVLNLEGQNILCIGGAISVDRMLRKTKLQREGKALNVPGYQWWTDEGVVYNEKKVNEFRNIDVVVTHTCPDYCPPDNRTHGNLGWFVENTIKNTGDVELRVELEKERREMTRIFETLKTNNNIKFHYYGHYHRNDIYEDRGTKHRVLGEGQMWEEKDYYNDNFHNI